MKPPDLDEGELNRITQDHSRKAKIQTHSKQATLHRAGLGRSGLRLYTFRKELS
jgi:hypothetical protein